MQKLLENNIWNIDYLGTYGTVCIICICAFLWVIFSILETEKSQRGLLRTNDIENDIFRMCYEEKRHREPIANREAKGQRARDRQRLTYLNNVKEWTNTANRNDFIQACEERERDGDVWGSMIVNLLTHDTWQRRKVINLPVWFKNSLPFKASINIPIIRVLRFEISRTCLLYIHRDTINTASCIDTLENIKLGRTLRLLMVLIN